MPNYPLISSNEDKFTYDYLLQFIKTEAKTAPLAVMADGSKAISSSCHEKLPDSKRLMCWYHACTKMREKLVGVKNLDAAISNNILDDITTLQYGAPDEESFDILFGLLTRKWTKDMVYMTDILRERVAAFFSYVEKVWMSPDLKNWFEAANPMMLSTNNSLEVTNNVFKRDFTGRRRVSMPNLVQKLKEFV